MKHQSRLTIFLLVIIPVFSVIWIMSEIDPVGNYPDSKQGPGLTIDESFNVEQGYILFESMSLYGFALVDPSSGKQIFSLPGYLPDHPPLGRLAIGTGHRIGNSFSPTDHPAAEVSIVSARWSSAFVFGLQLFIIGYAASRWYGSVAGISSMIALLVMPRVFGHAHLASLETMMNLTYSITVIAIASFWKPGNKITYKQIIIAGFFLGMALLTKIQGVLIPIPVGIWALYHWRKKSILPVILWGAFGVLVFFFFWPWLWLDPIEHFMQYLGRTTDRVPLKNWYWGQSWKDVDVPFHYSFIMFAVTVPVGLLAMGILSLFSKKHSLKSDPKKQLLLLCAFFPFLIFAKSGTAVYDGVRLFLVAYPLWAILVGQGAAMLFSAMETKFSKAIATVVMLMVFSSQAVGNISMSPCYLSYYNLFTGGLAGAEKLGFEVTYWGDSLTRDFLKEVIEVLPENTKLKCFPVLHLNQLRTIQNQSPLLAESSVKLVAYDGKHDREKEYLLIFHKKADIEEPLTTILQNAKLLKEFSMDGVWLAALFEISHEDALISR